MFRIKICGVRSRQDVVAIVEAGADAVGFNFFPRSVRYISPWEASQIAAGIPRGIAKVGVFVNSPLGEIREIAFRVGLHWIQLHGDETPDLLLKLRPLNCIKAFRVGPGGLDPVRQFLGECKKINVVPSAILFDAVQDGEYGGTGQTWDWDLAVEYQQMMPDVPPLILSGGLNPDNVRKAVATVRPAAVDVASGVEDAPGKKSPERIKLFVAAAKEAWAAVQQA
ncbi:MAG: phosphoribosylanthranilate isomerase [Thermogutta sp.]